MSLVHVGRQPIFDRALDVLGYELLFRADEEAVSASEGGDMATTRVIVNTFTEFGLETLVGRRLAFVNITRPFVVGTVPVPFVPEVAVLELLESVPADQDAVAGVEALRTQGYALALDDFAFEAERTAFLPLVDYVKLDMMGVEPGVLAERVLRCRELGLKTVAERVSSEAAMELATGLGFDYYQGYHLLRPEVVSAPSVSPSRLSALQLLARLSDPEVGLDEIESIVRVDLALNYRMLRAANAAASGAKRRIDSIHDALVLLGLRQLRSWLLLMTLADAGNANEEQLSTAMTRARTCELLAREVGTVKADAAFVAGLLSSLELVLGLPMDTLLERLPLTDELTAALTRHEGPLGQLVAAVLAYEAEDLAAVERSGMALFDVSRAYLAAVGWSLQTFESALSVA